MSGIGSTLGLVGPVSVYCDLVGIFTGGVVPGVWHRVNAGTGWPGVGIL